MALSAGSALCRCSSWSSAAPAHLLTSIALAYLGLKLQDQAGGCMCLQPQQAPADVTEGWWPLLVHVVLAGPHNVQLM